MLHSGAQTPALRGDHHFPGVEFEHPKKGAYVLVCSRSRKCVQLTILNEFQCATEGAKMIKARSQDKLYERDFVEWCEDTITKLKAQQFSEIDIESLAEEIEGLAGRDRRELRNRLRILLTHLLKRIYVVSPDDYRGWESTIKEQRRQLQYLLEQSPSLRNYLVEMFLKTWKDALCDTREDYPQVEFPEEWTFSLDVDILLSEKLW